MGDEDLASSPPPTAARFRCSRRSPPLHQQTHLHRAPHSTESATFAEANSEQLQGISLGSESISPTDSEQPHSSVHTYSPFRIWPGEGRGPGLVALGGTVLPQLPVHREDSVSKSSSKNDINDPLLLVIFPLVTGSKNDYRNDLLLLVLKETTLSRIDLASSPSAAPCSPPTAASFRSTANICFQTTITKQIIYYY